jgi:4-hydroxy-4-methyl-2-oxoglutarate aldolase
MIQDAPQLQTQAIIRPDPKLIEKFRGTPTGFLVDAMGGSGALDFRIKPAVSDQYAFCGVALTCYAGPADNLALVHALQYVESGDVLMVATDSFTGCAVTGDLVLGMAKNSGAVGFVTDGCVRDLVGLKNVGLPAWSVGITPNSPHRNGPGTIGYPINIAGFPVRSGDLVVADLDGVVIIPIEKMTMVLEKLPSIRSAEASADESVRQGARLPGFLKK